MPGMLTSSGSDYNAPTITVSWTSSVGIVDKYNVTLTPSDGGSPLPAVQTAANSTQISNTLHGTRYNVSIIAMSVLTSNPRESQPKVEQIRTNTRS